MFLKRYLFFFPQRLSKIEMQGSAGNFVYDVGEFRLDLRRRKLSRADGAAVPLTGKSFDALAYLVKHAGVLVPRAELAAALWPTTIVEDNNLNVAISTLRRALGDERPNQRYLVTVAGRGYQLVADVRVVSDGERPTDVPVGEPTPAAAGGAEPRAGARRGTGMRSHTAIVAAAAFAVVVAVTLIVSAVRGWQSEPQSQPPSPGAAALGAVQRVSPVTSYPGSEWSPSLSPSGEHVAFAWNDGSGEDVYVTRIGAQDPLRLTTDVAPDIAPAWSPDGTQIAFIRQLSELRGDLYVVPALGGPERKLLELQSNFAIGLPWAAPLLAWTPDGKQLLFTGQTDDAGDVATSFDFYLLSLETGEVRMLPIAGEGFDTCPAFSPDGTRLAFTRYGAVSRDGEIMVQDLDAGWVPRGAPQRVPEASLQYPGSPVWSPDSTRLVFMRASQVLEWTVGGSVRPLYAATGHLAALSMVWRPTGQPRVVASRSESDLDIWMLPLDPITHAASGAPVRRIGSTARDEHPRFSPDGRRIAFVSWRGGGGDLWIADADGGRQRQISRFGASDPGLPRWSPDGSQLAFVAWIPNGEPHIYLVDPDEGLPQLLTSGSSSGWSRDGRWLYGTQLDGISSAFRLRLADGHREELLVDGIAAQESADGTQIFYMRRGEAGIFARSLVGDVATNPEKRLVDDYWYPPSAGFQAVDDGIFYVSYSSTGRARALRFYDAASGRASDVAPLPAEAGSVWGITVSPDERELLYTVPGSGFDLVALEF
jgi:Tol biopolymer transport system component/DNA-binding winged helix-turn-helix (wHTH) protein